MTIDPQYTVGFSWARQYGFRVVKDLSNKVWFGLSVEDAQETITSHGNSNNYLIGPAGNGGGLYNGGVSGCSTSVNAAGAPAPHSAHPWPVTPTIRLPILLAS